MLGPIVNPSQPKNQLIGVYNLELARAYHYLYQQLDKNYAVVHSLDGYDKISLTSPAKVYTNNGEMMLRATDFNFPILQSQQIAGGKDIPSSSKIFIDVLEGKGTPAQESVVIANAALALQLMKPSMDLSDSVELASISLKQKHALKSFQTLIDLQ